MGPSKRPDTAHVPAAKRTRTRRPRGSVAFELADEGYEAFAAPTATATATAAKEAAATAKEAVEAAKEAIDAAAATAEAANAAEEAANAAKEASAASAQDALNDHIDKLWYALAVSQGHIRQVCFILRIPDLTKDSVGTRGSHGACHAHSNDSIVDAMGTDGIHRALMDAMDTIA